MAPKKKRAFVDSLVGMLLTELGVGSPLSFSPEHIPDEFRQGRGRPRLVQAGETEEE